MIEKAREQSLGRYLAVKEAMAGYGPSERFEDEQSFSTAPSSAGIGATSLTVVGPSNLYVKAGPGSGKTFIVTHRGIVVHRFEIAPATLSTSGTVETFFPAGQGGSMATQQPPITDDESVEELIWRVRTMLPVPYRARLASRLRELQRAVQEEELDGRGIAVGSLQNFIELLKAHPALRCPAISVTPDGNIYASWKSGPNEIFSINFLPDGKVRFVIFHPNNKHPGEAIRQSGTATVDVIIGVAAPHGVLAWASE
jgi:hypothetical protein